MLSPFINFIDCVHPVSEALKERLLNDLEIIELPKRHCILKEGQRNDHISFVMSGLLRAYYMKDDADICSRFMPENHICFSVISFYTRKPGYEYIETLEPTLLAQIHYDKLQKIYRDHIEFNYVTRIWTEHYCSMSEQRLYLLRRQNAEDRYLFFLENYPTLLQRLPLTYIASYLGMKLETLSRVRKKLAT